MKTLKVMAVMAALMLLEIFFTGCCNCEDPISDYYELDALSTHHLDNSGAEAVISESNSILKEAYGIGLVFSTRQISMADEPGFSFLISPALATSCRCEEWQYSSRDEILSITVTTLKDFNDQFPAGSNVTDLFRVYGNQQFLTMRAVEARALPVFYMIGQGETFEKQLLLTHGQPDPGEHQFRIDVRLEREVTLTHVTSAIVLN
jgi:hypothetical protein